SRLRASSAGAPYLCRRRHAVHTAKFCSRSSWRRDNRRPPTSTLRSRCANYSVDVSSGPMGVKRAASTASAHVRSRATLRGARASTLQADEARRVVFVSASRRNRRTKLERLEDVGVEDADPLRVATAAIEAARGRL